MSAEKIHLPSALVGEFPGLSRSHARRLISQGAVRLNGVVVTDLDVDLDDIPGDPVEIKVGHDMTAESLLQVLAVDAVPTHPQTPKEHEECARLAGLPFKWAHEWRAPQTPEQERS